MFVYYSAANNCEDNIAAARRFYNANVKIFNSKIKTFPTNVVANTLKLSSESYFTINDYDRKDINLDI